MLHIVDISMSGGKQEEAMGIVNHDLFLNNFQQFVLNTEKKRAKKNFTKTLKENDVEVLEVNQSGLGGSKFMRKIGLLRTYLKIRPSVIILWSVMPLPVFIWAASVIFKAKIIFWDHGVSRMRNPTRSKILGLKLCNLILCNSHSTQKMLEVKWQIDNAKICLNAVRNNLLPESLPDRHPPSNDKVKIGFAGRLVTFKGVGLIITATNLLNKRGINAHLYIAGEKNGEYNFLKFLAKEDGIEENVTFMGNVSDMSGFYQSIDILVCPSLSESFGLVSIESAGNGCPVIISDIDGLSETVVHDVTGLALSPEMSLSEYKAYVSNTDDIPDSVFFPKEKKFDEPKALYPQEIAEAVVHLISNTDLYNSFSRRGYNRTKKKFTMEQHAECVLSNIKKVI